VEQWDGNETKDMDRERKKAEIKKDNGGDKQQHRQPGEKGPQA